MRVILTEEQWLRRSAAHESRLAPFLDAHLARSRRGEQHPVWDFLFTYYNLRPAHLRRWHPGLGIELAGRAAAIRYGGWRGYRVTPPDPGADGTPPDPGGDGQVTTVDRAALVRRAGTAAHVWELLTATASRPAALGCFGLHEWAMVFRSDASRHRVPLRLGSSGTDAVVEAGDLRCTHYDAYRFFTPDAAPRNRRVLTRDVQIATEQPGCLHAGMDLYKWAGKLLPGVGSDLLADAFELARDARELDMAASPYDLRGHGLDPVPIETPAGRADYVRRQSALAQRATPIRARLAAVCAAWPGVA